MHPIIFIGGIGNPEQFGGELTKYKSLIKAIQRRDDKGL
jgi:cobyrinic acid a,c-diamide synthase